MDEQSTERWKGEPEPQKSELPTVTENEKRGHGKRSSPRTLETQNARAVARAAADNSRRGVLKHECRLCAGHSCAFTRVEQVIFDDGAGSGGLALGFQHDPAPSSVFCSWPSSLTTSSCLLARNVKPAARQSKTQIFWAKLIAAELYGDLTPPDAALRLSRPLLRHSARPGNPHGVFLPVSLR